MSKRDRWISAGLLVSLAALVVSGCGSSGGAPPANPEVVAKLREGGTAAGGAASTAAVSTGTGWASLTGSFVFEGTPPAQKVLPTGGKDAPTCNPNGIPDDALLVDSASKGIKNILIYARKVSRTNESYAAAADTPVTFDQKNCMFLTHLLAVRTGQTIDLHNGEENVGHNVSISPRGDKSTNPLLLAGKSDTYAFSRQQGVPVPVTCSIHPWMKAFIIPRENPYFAVTDQQGGFKIADLPAGEEIEFQLWHELASGADGALVIPNLTNAKGQFKKKLAEGETLDLGAIQVPPADFKY